MEEDYGVVERRRRQQNPGYLRIGPANEPDLEQRPGGARFMGLGEVPVGVDKDGNASGMAPGFAAMGEAPRQMGRLATSGSREVTPAADLMPGEFSVAVPKGVLDLDGDGVPDGAEVTHTVTRAGADGGQARTTSKWTKGPPGPMTGGIWKNDAGDLMTVHGAMDDQSGQVTTSAKDKQFLDDRTRAGSAMELGLTRQERGRRAMRDIRLGEADRNRANALGVAQKQFVDPAELNADAQKYMADESTKRTEKEQTGMTERTAAEQAGLTGRTQLTEKGMGERTAAEQAGQTGRTQLTEQGLNERLGRTEQGLKERQAADLALKEREAVYETGRALSMPPLVMTKDGQGLKVLQPNGTYKIYTVDKVKKAWVDPATGEANGMLNGVNLGELPVDGAAAPRAGVQPAGAGGGAGKPGSSTLDLFYKRQDQKK